MPGPGTRLARAAGDNGCMATGWTQRLASAPHALAIAGTVLALAALGQAVAQA